MKLTDGKTFAEISITRNGDCRGDLADKYYRTTFPDDSTPVECLSEKTAGQSSKIYFAFERILFPYII